MACDEASPPARDGCGAFCGVERSKPRPRALNPEPLLVPAALLAAE